MGEGGGGFGFAEAGFHGTTLVASGVLCIGKGSAFLCRPLLKDR